MSAGRYLQHSRDVCHAIVVPTSTLSHGESGFIKMMDVCYLSHSAIAYLLDLHCHFPVLYTLNLLHLLSVPPLRCIHCIQATAENILRTV